MQDARDWQVPVGDRLHSGPRQPMSLAAAHQRPCQRSIMRCRNAEIACCSSAQHSRPFILAGPGQAYRFAHRSHRGGSPLRCSLISRSLVRMRLAIGFLPSTKPVPIPPGRAHAPNSGSRTSPACRGFERGGSNRKPTKLDEPRLIGMKIQSRKRASLALRSSQGIALLQAAGARNQRVSVVARQRTTITGSPAAHRCRHWWTH